MSKTLIEQARRYAAFVLMERENKAIDADTLALKVRDFGAYLCSVDLITHSLPNAGFYDVKDDIVQARKLYALSPEFYKEMVKQTKEIGCVETDGEVIGFIKAYKLCRNRPKLIEIFNKAVQNFTGTRSDLPQKSPQAHQDQN